MDFLKGLACILMVLAHSAGAGDTPLAAILAGQGSQLVRLAYLAGEAAPVLFFSVSGVAAYLQARRYSPGVVFVSCLLMFLLGFSYNGITQGDFYREPRIEILQIIAVGTLAVYCLARVRQRASVLFLALSVAAFAVKVASDYMPELTDLLLLKKEVFVPPGAFPLFPWLSLFFGGAFAYSAQNRSNLVMAAACALLLLVLRALSFPLQLTNKWDMSVGYFLLSLSAVFLCFYVVRRFGYFRRKDGKRLVLFWGQSSLLFLFVHKTVISALHGWLSMSAQLAPWPIMPIAFWSTVIVVTTILMIAILACSRRVEVSRWFEDIRPWVLLMCLVLSVPILVENGTMLYALELAFGIVFAAYYPVLRRSIQGARSQVLSA